MQQSLVEFGEGLAYLFYACAHEVEASYWAFLASSYFWAMSSPAEEQKMTSPQLLLSQELLGKS